MCSFLKMGVPPNHPFDFRIVHPLTVHLFNSTSPINIGWYLSTRKLSIGKPHLISKFQVFKGTPISYIMVDNRDIMGYLSMSLFFPWWDSWCQGAQSAPGGPCNCDSLSSWAWRQWITRWSWGFFVGKSGFAGDFNVISRIQILLGWVIIGFDMKQKSA